MQKQEPFSDKSRSVIAIPKGGQALKESTPNVISASALASDCNAANNIVRSATCMSSELDGFAHTNQTIHNTASKREEEDTSELVLQSQSTMHNMMGMEETEEAAGNISAMVGLRDDVRSKFMKIHEEPRQQTFSKP